MSFLACCRDTSAVVVVDGKEHQQEQAPRVDVTHNEDSEGSDAGNVASTIAGGNVVTKTSKDGKVTTRSYTVPAPGTATIVATAAPATIAPTTAVVAPVVGVPAETSLEFLLGSRLLELDSHKLERVVDTKDVLRGKELVVLCFCAHWRPVAQRFMLSLRNLGDAYEANDVQFVYVSVDLNRSEFMTAFRSLPESWVAMPRGGAAELKNCLSRRLHVNETLFMVVLHNRLATLITDRGVEQVQSLSHMAGNYAGQVQALVNFWKETPGVPLDALQEAGPEGLVYWNTDETGQGPTTCDVALYRK